MSTKTDIIRSEIIAALADRLPFEGDLPDKEMSRFLMALSHAELFDLNTENIIADAAVYCMSDAESIGRRTREKIVSDMKDAQLRPSGGAG
jgi:hypothetical protein